MQITKYKIQNAKISMKIKMQILKSKMQKLKCEIKIVT